MSTTVIGNDKYRATVDHTPTEDRAVVTIRDTADGWRHVRSFSGLASQVNALRFAREFFDDPENPAHVIR